jgi:hypothetical protein
VLAGPARLGVSGAVFGQPSGLAYRLISPRAIGMGCRTLVTSGAGFRFDGLRALPTGFAAAPPANFPMRGAGVIMAIG